MEVPSTTRQAVKVTLLTIILLAALLSADIANAQKRITEEIVVTFEVRRLVSEDLFVRYDGESLYLPLSRLFDILDMNVTIDQGSKQVSGFLFTPQDRFAIDYNLLIASVRSQELPLTRNMFIVTVTEFYLRLDQFERLFDLPMIFNFNELQIVLPLDENLPVFLRLKRHRQHERLRRKSEAIRDVQALDFHRSIANGGSLDWQMSANLVGRQGHYFNTDIGGILLGGDLVASVAGNSYTGVDPDQLNYRWRYSFLDNSYLSQVALGDIFTVGALGRNLNGVLVTNRPLVQRRFFQTVNITDQIGAGWEVELYVDNSLVDFTVTDAGGEYQFNVDLIYGNSQITLKMYGPNGEIRTEHKYYLVPFNLIPKNVFEYSAAFGTSNVFGEEGRYAQAQTFYGISDRVTTGLSAEIPVGSTTDENPIVSGEIGIHVGGGLTAGASMSPNNAIEANVAYTRSSLISLTAGFKKFYPSPFRNPIHQEIRAVFSATAPLKIKGRLIGLRYLASYDQFAAFRSIQMNYGLTSMLGRLHINYLGRYRVSQYTNRSIDELVSRGFLSMRLYKWIRPQLRLTYNHTFNEFEKYGIFLAKRIFKTGQVSFSFERNEAVGSSSFMITLNLLSGFLNSTTRAISTERGLSINQLQRGSIRYDHNGKRIRFDRRNAVGYGSAVIRPFLDDNYNGVMDTGEQWLPGIRARLNGASGIPSGGDKLHYYDRLRPYDNYLVQIDQYSLDDPTLKPVHENYRVTLSPNIVTAINVPVVVTSEISGTINRQLPSGSELGVGGIKIQVMNLTSEALTEIISFNNGEFYYLGLTPGSYRAYVDPEQLAAYGYVAEPSYIEFIVEPSAGGVSIENIKFLLIRK